MINNHIRIPKNGGDSDIYNGGAADVFFDFIKMINQMISYNQ